MSWWHRNNLRLIQNNIRETDAAMDVEQLLSKIKALSANTLMLNTGGITAFYPTELEYQYRSPYLKGDLIGEVVEKCHREGMRFIARFDFSKAHYSIFEKHPEWFYKSAAGNSINYNEMVHTCVNGKYQREYSLEIIREVITKYPVDGIFFNMFGYQTRDYSDIYHGICNCENCKNRFKEMFGRELPEREDRNDPAYQDYITFKEITTRELLDNIHQLVKSINPEIAISTYTDYRVDMVRNESNSAVDRPYPFWLYSASENVKAVEDSWEDKVISNCAINAVDIFYRFVGVSKYLTRTRLYENMASGSGLDFCIIGVFEDYPDEDGFEMVKEVFDFHKKHEQYYGNFTSVAEIALVKPGLSPMTNGSKEYQGIFKMLKEEHILFDVLCQCNLENRLQDLGRYSLLILPDHRMLLNDKLMKVVGEKGIHVMVTNSPAEISGDDMYRLEGILGGRIESTTAETRSAYLETRDKNIFKRFPKRNWVFVDGSFSFLKYGESNLKLLPYITPARYGPPEKCGGHAVSEYYGASIKNDGAGSMASIPWQIGYLYYQYGYEDHKNVFLDLMDHLLESRYSLVTEAPKNVEVFLNKYDGKNYILQILNLTGFNGTTFYEPNPVYDLKFTIRGIKSVECVKCLAVEDNVNWQLAGNELQLTISRLDAYESVIINVQE